MSTAVLLTTMRCNIECGHCSVDAHPYRSERMPIEAALAYLRQLAAMEGLEHVDLSGGEPLLHLQDVKTLAAEAQRLGVAMRVTTNGSWASSRQKAVRLLAELREAGLAGIGVSIDEWHLDFIKADTVRHYVDGCRATGFQPFVSVVVRGRPSDAIDGIAPPGLAELLLRYGLAAPEAMPLRTWEAARARLDGGERALFEAEARAQHVLYTWQILTGEGRARRLAPIGEAIDTSADEACPAAGDLPTIDPAGRLYPCCSPWTSRKGHAYPSAGMLDDAIRRMRESALVTLIRRFGPRRLIVALRAAGIRLPDTYSGICNQCGQLLDRFSLAELEAAAAWLLDHELHGQAYRILQVRPRLSLLATMTAARARPKRPYRVIMMAKAENAGPAGVAPGACRAGR